MHFLLRYTSRGFAEYIKKGMCECNPSSRKAAYYFRCSGCIFMCTAIPLRFSRMSERQALALSNPSREAFSHRRLTTFVQTLPGCSATSLFTAVRFIWSLRLAWHYSLFAVPRRQYHRCRYVHLCLQFQR